MNTQIVASIIPASQEELNSLISKGLLAADLIEVRLENGFWPQKSFDNMPIMLTLRGSHDYVRVSKYNPLWIDIPIEDCDECVPEIRQASPQVKIQASFHNYKNSEGVLEAIKRMNRMDVDAIKIACRCTNVIEVLDLVLLLKDLSLEKLLLEKLLLEKPLTVVPMGDKVSYGRILAAISGSYFTFGSIEGSQTAPGQVDICSLKDHYRVKTSQDIYALIGHPVEHSLSHKTHNIVFKSLGIDSCYIKIDMVQSEVEKAIPLLVRMGLKGVSVTMPLKENFTDKPINTIKFLHGTSYPINTDGRAVQELLAEHVNLSQSKVLILGAGGAAKAIAQALSDAGSFVIISNRTSDKAESIADEIGCTTWPFDKLDDVVDQVDIIVQATSVGYQGIGDLPISDSVLRKNLLVLDVIFPDESPFLKRCRKLGLKTITGTAMWVRQASYQFEHWLSVSPKSVEPILTSAIHD